MQGLPVDRKEFVEAAARRQLQHHGRVQLGDAQHFTEQRLDVADVQHRGVADDAVEFAVGKPQGERAALLEGDVLDFLHLRPGARQGDALGVRVNADDLALAAHAHGQLDGVRAGAAIDIEEAPFGGQFDVLVDQHVETLAPVRRDE